MESIKSDRIWYDNEEEQVVDLSLDNQNVPFESLDKIAGLHVNSRKTVSKASTKRFLLNEDHEKWEENRLLVSGALGRNSGLLKTDSPDNDHEKRRVQLILLEIKSPFLGDKEKFSLASGNELIIPVKDPTSDLAVLARKGSSLVRVVREKRERERQMKELEGKDSSLGRILLPKNDRRNSFHHSKRLAAEGVPASPLSSLSSKSIKDQREFLPAFACKAKLLQMISENQVLVVVGETGSGKTTQLAQYLYESGFSRSGIIGCTQPRRVAAMSVAKRVSFEMNCKLGALVGYAIRFEDCTSCETRIKYMTDGIFLRETLKDSEIEQYSVIIIDEAHERSLQTDTILGLLRQIIKHRRDLKVIVTSATMNAEKFSNFFGGVPIFTIPGRTFKVEVFHSKGPIEDYVEEAVRQTTNIHIAQPPGDILVFLTGQEDIDVASDCLHRKIESLRQGPGGEKVPELLILPIYSQLPADLQAQIFMNFSGSRKCIIATNIAETSLTVDGVRYVVDCGFSKVKVYNPRIGMDALQIYPISQAAANQRAGRAGRTGPGVCFRLYTESAYRYEMFANNVPEIQRTNLSNVVLLLKSLGIKDLMQFGFVDPPPLESLKSAMHQLWILGALDDNGELTARGTSMVNYPLDPPLALMMIIAARERCVDDITTIVSMLSVPPVFFRPKERAAESDICRERFIVPESDHLTLLNVYRQWVHNSRSDTWCERNFLNSRSLIRASEVRKQLIDIIGQTSSSLESAGSDWSRICRCISSAYLHKVARLKAVGEYVNIESGLPCNLHPTSALYGLSYTPEYVVYHELVMTSKEYMQCVTAVDPEWLAMECPQMYSLRVVNFTPSGLNAQIVSYLAKEQSQHPVPKDESQLENKDSTAGIIEKPDQKSSFFKRKRGIQ